MKLSTVIAMTIALGALTAFAQTGPGGPGGPGAGPGPRGGGRGGPGGPGVGGFIAMSPLMVALDANTNGVVEATEIETASVALAKLDKNGDRKLSAEELEPQRPGGKGRLPAAEDRGLKVPRRPNSPLMAALDQNNDGILDTTEISGAAAALKALDTSGDSQLTREELMPARGGRGGPGGPPGQKR